MFLSSRFRKGSFMSGFRGKKQPRGNGNNLPASIVPSNAIEPHVEVAFPEPQQPSRGDR